MMISIIIFLFLVLMVLVVVGLAAINILRTGLSLVSEGFAQCLERDGCAPEPEKKSRTL